MILSESEAKVILEKASKFSKADGIRLNLNGSNDNNIRFALNSLSTNGYADGLSLEITSYLGKKSGSSSTNSFDDESIKRAIKISENIAKLSPDNPEFVPLPDQYNYQKGINHSEKTKNLTQDERINLIRTMISKADKNNLQSAGFLQDYESFSAVYNSKGLYGYNLKTNIDFSATARTMDGTGSSKVYKTYHDFKKLNIDYLSDKVIERSKLSANPVEIKPGKYTVILEPDAVADMISYMFYFMDARTADEGRSYFSKKNGGNVIGDIVCDQRVNIYNDPFDKNAPADIFDNEGLPIKHINWIKNGELKNLIRSRYWALKTNSEPLPFPSNLIMTGTQKSTEELIKETDNGILVSRLWYIRTVDPKTLLLTGLTRDGIFEIQKGKIFRSIKNFRFNESPVNILNNLLDIGTSEKATGSESDWLHTYVPALKIKDFNFSSISDAI